MALGRKKADASAKKKAAPAKPAGPSRREKLRQIKAAFSMTRKADPKMLPLVIGVFVITLVVAVALGVVLGHPIYFSILGVLLAAVLTAFVFGRRVQRTAYRQVEGQAGAAAAVLQNMTTV